MPANITLRQLNPSFNKQYAEQIHHGEQSDGNWKYNWSKTIGIRGNVIEFEIQENAIFLSEELEIRNVTIFKYSLESGESVDVVISRSLIEKTHMVKNEKYNSSRLYVYFKDTDNFYALSDIIYIAKEDYPGNLA